VRIEEVRGFLVDLGMPVGTDDQDIEVDDGHCGCDRIGVACSDQGPFTPPESDELEVMMLAMQLN
jgi:hypothetical protein